MSIDKINEEPTHGLLDGVTGIEMFVLFHFYDNILSIDITHIQSKAYLYNSSANDPRSERRKRGYQSHEGLHDKAIRRTGFLHSLQLTAPQSALSQRNNFSRSFSMTTLYSQ